MPGEKSGKFLVAVLFVHDLNGVGIDLSVLKIEDFTRTIVILLMLNFAVLSHSSPQMPHTLWISELFLRISNRHPKLSGQPLSLRRGHDRSL